MTIKLQLFPSLILEAIKAETHIKGQIDRAADDKAAKVAYQEEAGDEQFHERKLTRCIYTALDTLKSELSDWLDTTGSTTGDNIASTTEFGQKDSITLTLVVGDNFNRGMTDTLARLCSKFIEDASLVLWWGTFNPNQAQFYTTLQVSDLTAIHKCFIKMAPAPVTPAYTAHIYTEGNEIQMSKGEKDTLTYLIDEGCIDDVELSTTNPHIAHIERTREGFLIHAKHPGICIVRLYSRHDEDVFKDIKVSIHRV